MKYPKCQEQNINYQNLKTQELSWHKLSSQQILNAKSFQNHVLKVLKSALNLEFYTNIIVRVKGGVFVLFCFVLFCLFCFPAGLPWATSPPLFLCAGFFRDRVSQIIFPGWLQTMTLLISASWVPRITAVSHWSERCVLIVKTIQKATTYLFTEWIINRKMNTKVSRRIQGTKICNFHKYMIRALNM
jgi:hypothetical protein